MEISRSVYAPVTRPTSVEFYSYSTDNLIRIENHPDRVVVRAMRDNLSEQARSAAIRQWALEGFIPDMYQWLAEAGVHGVEWKVDTSWITPKWKATRLISRYGRPVIATTFMFLLLGLMLYFGLTLQPSDKPVWGRRFGPTTTVPGQGANLTSTQSR